MSDRTLKVKCATWDHVENFYSQKVKPGNLLSARVPFNPMRGTGITLSIELPNELVIAIECEVREVKPAPDGKRSAVVLFVHGLTAEVSGQLRRLVDEGRARRKQLRQSTIPPRLHPPKQQSRTPSTELPVPIPMDAPIDEVIPPPSRPKVTDVVARYRPVFIELDKFLRSLRESAAHEVLDVTWDASVSDIRAAYFELTKAYHPDVYSRYRSQAISELSQDVFIYINKAYDRMRDAAVEAGHAIAAGPALIEHQGWFAGFDDIGTGVRSRPLRIERPKPKQQSERTPVPKSIEPTKSSRISVRFAKPLNRSDVVAQKQTQKLQGATSPGVRAAAGAEKTKPAAKKAQTPEPPPPPPPNKRAESQLDAGSLFGDVGPGEESRAIDLVAPETKVDEGKVDELGTQARSAMENDDFDEARDLLAAALQLDPRRRDLRALYHVAYGLQLLKDGKSVDARTQFEAALVHDRDCKEAQQAMESSGADSKKGGLFRRLFR